MYKRYNIYYQNFLNIVSKVGKYIAPFGTKHLQFHKNSYSGG